MIQGRKRAEYHKATYVPKKIFKTEEEKIAEFYKNNPEFRS